MTARRGFQPGLFCGVPLVAFVVLLSPELGAIWVSIGAVVVYCGASLWLIQTVRDRGKALEARLYRSWGGKPSVAMLRHRDDRLDSTTKARYRRFLCGAVPDLVLASPEGERDDPEQADARLESANRWLLAQTTDHARFALLFTENMNYGYRRNLLGMRRDRAGTGRRRVGARDLSGSRLLDRAYCQHDSEPRAGVVGESRDCGCAPAGVHRIHSGGLGAGICGDVRGATAGGLRLFGGRWEVSLPRLGQIHGRRRKRREVPDCEEHKEVIS